MTTLPLRAGPPAGVQRGLIRTVAAAMSATVAQIIDVFAEAADLSAAARSRYPLAD